GEYLQGALSLMEAKSRMKFRTHDYARRQITWFRKNPYVRWIETRVEAHKTVKKFLKEKKTA
ncbi:MAG: tRNA (adenosine(37)-N6)-dimethylallyltransferase MiaA, partial [bacterium]|nr:tRNA (adenosine(37)-N6)-dimethylallyltransferase MiaA [bacterium]